MHGCHTMQSSLSGLIETSLFCDSLSDFGVSTPKSCISSILSLKRDAPITNEIFETFDPQPDKVEKNYSFNLDNTLWHVNHMDEIPYKPIKRKNIPTANNICLGSKQTLFNKISMLMLNLQLNFIDVELSPIIKSPSTFFQALNEGCYSFTNQFIDRVDVELHKKYSAPRIVISIFRDKIFEMTFEKYIDNGLTRRWYHDGEIFTSFGGSQIATVSIIVERPEDVNEEDTITIHRARKFLNTSRESMFTVFPFLVNIHNSTKYFIPQSTPFMKNIRTTTYKDMKVYYNTVRSSDRFLFLCLFEKQDGTYIGYSLTKYFQNIQESLHEACKQENFETVCSLLDNGAEADFNSFRCVCENGNLRIFERLLEEDHDIIYEEDCRLLCLASSHKNSLSIICRMIELGADVNAQKSTPMRVASMEGCFDIVKKLIDSGATINDFTVSDAARNGNIDIVNLLVENNADIHAHDNLAFRYAILYSHHELVIRLLELGSKVTEKELNYAIENHDTKMLSILEEHYDDTDVVLH